jgi:hypothetical protein
MTESRVQLVLIIDHDNFNIFHLKPGPVGFCAFERSLSALWRLKIWCRATMTEDCLCGLAMLHVHRNDTVGQINPEAVLKR